VLQIVNKAICWYLIEKQQIYKIKLSFSLNMIALLLLRILFLIMENIGQNIYLSKPRSFLVDDFWFCLNNLNEVRFVSNS
jgi:hypothetical protein